jgi:hypothetical protein
MYLWYGACWDRSWSRVDPHDRKLYPRAVASIAIAGKAHIPLFETVVKQFPDFAIREVRSQNGNVSKMLLGDFASGENMTHPPAMPELHDYKLRTHRRR